LILLAKRYQKNPQGGFPTFQIDVQMQSSIISKVAKGFYFLRKALIFWRRAFIFWRKTFIFWRKAFIFWRKAFIFWRKAFIFPSKSHPETLKS